MASVPKDRPGHFAGCAERRIHPELNLSCANQEVIIRLSSRPEPK
jgi:hypothetical protein